MGGRGGAGQSRDSVASSRDCRAAVQAIVVSVRLARQQHATQSRVTVTRDHVIGWPSALRRAAAERKLSARSLSRSKHPFRSRAARHLRARPPWLWPFERGQAGPEPRSSGAPRTARPAVGPGGARQASRSPCRGGSRTPRVIRVCAPLGCGPSRADTIPRPASPARPMEGEGPGPAPPVPGRLRATRLRAQPRSHAPALPEHAPALHRPRRSRSLLTQARPNPPLLVKSGVAWRRQSPPACEAGYGLFCC